MVGFFPSAHYDWNDFAQYVASNFSKQDIGAKEISRDELTLTVLKAQALKILQFLRDDSACRFTQLIDMTATDYQKPPNRFAVVYHLLSLDYRRFLRVKVFTDIDLPVPSASAVYPAANWYEREIWDMFGIAFSSHDDLRRILTDEAFCGEPLKKDFPLSGEKILRYDENRGLFYYEPVSDDRFVVNRSKITELG